MTTDERLDAIEQRLMMRLLNEAVACLREGVVSDEDLLDEVATRVWSITDQGIEDFQGPYSEFLAKHA